jgi:hypothetical protein
MAFDITIFRSATAGPSFGWSVLKLERISVSVDLRESGSEISLHVYSAAEARALAAALIEAADITDAHLSAKDVTPC